MKIELYQFCSTFRLLKFVYYILGGFTYQFIIRFITFIVFIRKNDKIIGSDWFLG